MRNNAQRQTPGATTECRKWALIRRDSGDNNQRYPGRSSTVIAIKSTHYVARLRGRPRGHTRLNTLQVAAQFVHNRYTCWPA